MNRTQLTTVVCSLTILTFTGPVSAALWQVRYDGLLTHVDNELASRFSIGDSFVGTFVFDDTTREISSGAYLAESHELQVFAAGSSYQASAQSGFAFVSITNDTVQGDSYRAGASRAIGERVDESFIDSFSISLDDLSMTALSSWELPISLVLSDFDSPATLNIGFASLTADPSVRGEVTSIRFSPVPEPNSLMLLALVGLLLATRTRFSASRV